ncbi:MAG: rod shape-determining protein MreC [bacterium]|nr:rod shape-determining protein MreC [bacterium]
MTATGMTKILGGVFFLAFMAGLFWWGDFFLPLRQALLPYASRTSQLETLQSENIALRVELERFTSLKEQVSHVVPGTLLAEVYSRYPFNNKNELLIAVGAADGIKPKMAVTVNGLLVGRVEEVKDHLSLVKTIFDANLQLAVKVGDKGVNGLFKGGLSPEVSLIPKEAGVRPGSGVFSANTDLPYGLPLGEVAAIRDEPGEIWQTALLKISYDLENIKIVSIITNF